MRQIRFEWQTKQHLTAAGYRGHRLAGLALYIGLFVQIHGVQDGTGLQEVRACQISENPILGCIPSHLLQTADKVILRIAEPVLSQVEAVGRVDSRNEIESIQLFAADVYLLEDRADSLATVLLAEPDDRHLIVSNIIEDRLAELIE